MKSILISSLLTALCTQVAMAEDLTATRPEMKRVISELKQRTSRLPLPSPTAEEVASGKSLVNNGRLRSLYLPPSWQSFTIAGWGGGRNRSTAATLKTLQQSPDYAFKTRLFWIVSRTNDCKYCLGHQELKLRRAGMSENEIASLDSRWELFAPAEQASMKVARELTINPHSISQSDLDAMKSFYTDLQMTDLLYTIARYNCVNRWTSATGIPQDQEFGGEDSNLETPTSDEFSTIRSKVAPFDHQSRPEWESREQFEAALEAARNRTALVKMPSMEQARRVLGQDSPGVIPPNWFQAISGLPIALDAWAQRQALIRDGQTPADLRILIAWISARENRAWYSASHVLERIRSAGLDESKCYSFADLESTFRQPGYPEAIRFARKLTCYPHAIEDADVEQLKTHFSTHQIAEIIHLIADANAFDRLTESLRLPLDR
ncbi:MAG: carboxymuconolactone decarboxylase family protein [Planctomycetota bacterium]